MTKNPCKKCNDRNATCHSNCSKYAEWVQLHDQERKQVNEFLCSDADLYLIEKIKERKGKK